MSEEINPGTVSLLYNLEKEKKELTTKLKGIDKQIEVLQVGVEKELLMGKTSKYVHLETEEVKERVKWKEELIKLDGAKALELQNNVQMKTVYKVVLDEEAIKKDQKIEWVIEA